MSSRTIRIVTGLAVLVTVSFALHYALFGSLPLGKPALMRDDE